MTNAMNVSTTAPQAQDQDTFRWLALGAIAGPVVLAIGWIVLGGLRPATKDAYGVAGGFSGAISSPISGLGVGPNALAMNAVFVLSGLLLLAGVVGVFQTTKADARPAMRRVCGTLLALSPVGIVMAGIFNFESSLPLHIVAANLALVTPVLSFLAAGYFFRRIPRWRRFGTWLILGSALTLLLVVLFFLTFSPAAAAAGTGVAGLTERILITEIHAWFAAMGWLAFRRP